MFAVKSPATLNKRLGSMNQFLKWSQLNLTGCVLPISERDAWNYLCSLRDSDAPASRASAFLEACRFSWYVLGLDDLSYVEKSMRLKGLAAQSLAKRRPWSPASLLTVDEVLRLHAFLNDIEANLVDRVIAGHFLHLLYSRSRWSDLHCDKGPGYLGSDEISQGIKVC